MKVRTEAGYKWGIVLAGGAGRRLHALTTNRHGVPVPKQYCSLINGGPPLLVAALERAERVIPRERIVIVVAEEHVQYWAPLLSEWPTLNVLVQPRNQGTAPGILLPLLSILDRDPRARVALFPSDHFVEREAVLARCLHASLDAGHELERNVVLMGITPDAAEPDYGWILPGPRCGATHSVDDFIEKPGVERATELQRLGAVWNSFLLVASGPTLIGLYERRLPKLLADFQAARPHTSIEAARSFYRDAVAADFSRDVLEGSERFLQLQVVPSCGWTDLGTPDRVARCRSRQRSHVNRQTNCTHDLGVRRPAMSFGEVLSTSQSHPPHP